MWLYSIYNRLLNVVFDYHRERISSVAPTQGPVLPVTTVMIVNAIGEMKPGKPSGPSGITDEMLKASGPEGDKLIRLLRERILNGAQSLLNGNSASS